MTTAEQNRKLALRNPRCMDVLMLAVFFPFSSTRRLAGLLQHYLSHKRIIDIIDTPPMPAALSRSHEKTVVRCVDAGWLERAVACARHSRAHPSSELCITQLGLWALAESPTGLISGDALLTLLQSSNRDSLLRSIADNALTGHHASHVVCSHRHWHQMAGQMARLKRPAHPQSAWEGGVSASDPRQLPLDLSRKRRQGAGRANTGGSAPSPLTLVKGGK